MGALRNTMMSLAAFGMAAAPATAQDAVANNNDAQVTQVAATAPVSGSELCERWAQQARGMFPIVCADDMSVQLFNRSSQDISSRQLVVSVLGGTDETRLAVLQIVHGMAREGKSVAIAFGPDRDRSSITMELELYARDSNITTGANRINVNNIDRMRPELTSWLQDAYTTYFPIRVAENTGSTSPDALPR